MFLFFQFCKKKNEKLQFINGHFTTIYGHFSANHDKIFHKTEVQTVILRGLVYLYLNWIKSYDIILIKNFVFCIFCVFAFFCISLITFEPIKIQTCSASQNDRLNFSFVKDTHVVGEKMTRSGRKTDI